MHAPGIRLAFGRSASQCRVIDSTVIGELAMPCLGTSHEESILELPAGGRVEKTERLCVMRDEAGDWMGGLAIAPCQGPVEPVAHELYSKLLDALGGRALYRIWNFVPHINAEVGGREQYQSFNIGRGRAFREHYQGEAMVSKLPAASAVGIEDSVLAVAFLAGRAPVAYFENPRQVPAYHYPEQYGPSSPSFARGSVVTAPDGRRTGYLSGTSSIRGHATVGIGSLSEQFDTTVENIRTILERMGFDGALEPESPVEASFRVYLRHAADYETVRARFAEVVGPLALERTVFLQADICRAPLLIEIEGIFCE